VCQPVHSSALVALLLSLTKYTAADGAICVIVLMCCFCKYCLPKVALCGGQASCSLSSALVQGPCKAVPASTKLGRICTF
jgi:hypothetical protein